MATLTFNITVPDTQVPRIVAALRYVFGQPSATQAELLELVRKDVRDKVKSFVVNYEEIIQRQQGETPVVPPDVT